MEKGAASCTQCAHPCFKRDMLNRQESRSEAPINTHPAEQLQLHSLHQEGVVPLAQRMLFILSPGVMNYGHK